MDNSNGWIPLNNWDPNGTKMNWWRAVAYAEKKLSYSDLWKIEGSFAVRKLGLEYWLCPGEVLKSDTPQYSMNRSFQNKLANGKQDKIKNPSNILFVYEAVNTNNYFASDFWGVDYGTAANDVSTRHNGKSNILFFDGHVDVPSTVANLWYFTGMKW